MAFDIRADEEEDHPDEFEEYDDVKQPTPTKFYRRRKFWYFCIPNTIVTLIVAVMLGLYVIMPKIAQSLMNKATINFSQIDITNPTGTSMDLVMQGDMQHTGPFHADISFPGTVYVSWNGIQLGTTEIPGTSTASGGHGTLNLQSSFTVTNTTGFTEFTSYMLNAESFVWHLEGKLNVKALSHTVKNLNLKKDITVNAFNGLNGITIQKFSLPGDDPSGNGIIIEIDTAVNNPSAIQMYMGSLTLAISYKNTLMGYVTSTNLTMVRGAQILSMKGLLIPQNTTEGLVDVSDMMSRYIGNLVTDTIATGYDCKPDGVNSLEWLSAAVKNLKLTVPLQSPTPLQLIKALDLGALGLVFTTETAYEPLTTSTGVVANYSLPDGFDFNIQFTQVANSFALSRNNVTIANINSTYNPSSSNAAAGTLTFNLLQTPLIVPVASYEPFQEFSRDLTVGSDIAFNVIGEASVYANTSIGTVNLVNIPFNASTGLSGLQSLANPAPTITSLQVTGGTATDLTLAITVVIVNPSLVSLNAGDVILDLLYSGVNLGTVTMPNLAIVPGANTVQASSTINPASSPQGLELLALYTSGAGAAVSIAGTPNSTAIDSLSLAFGALNIGTQMPGLQSKLLVGASLVVLNTTIANGLAQTVVTINNPFVPAMTILSIDSKITYNGVSVGTVVSTFASPPVIPGTSQGSLTASLVMNTNPTDLVALIKAQALKNGLNTDAFDALLSLQNGGNPASSIFAGFNVADFTIKAMAGLVVDITLTTTVKVGDYQVTIPYTQTGVPTATDETILKLIPLVGTPIAQVLVEGAALAFDSIMIPAPGDASFLTDIVGAITNTGPLDAQLEFPNPVTISYDGKSIGSMMMPSVNVVANQGAPLNLTGVSFTITDLTAFSDFNVFAVNNAKFDWVISTTGLVVNAMGVSLPGVTMTKTVTLDGFNQLAGLELSSYIITSIDADGLHMVISATLPNPSTIGVVIPVSMFTTSFEGQVLGPAVVEGLTLIPHGNSSFALNATIAPGNGDLTPYLSGIFENAVGGVSTKLDAQGAGAPGVSWLDAAIKSLKLHTALPPLTAPPIESVSIDAMSMDFACGSCTWAPNAISTITAITNLPFANGAPIVSLSQNVQILDKNGQLVGALNTSYSPAVSSGNKVSSTSPSAALVIADGSHQIYEAFISDLSEAITYDLGLRGTADSILDLGVLGLVEVKGIKLDVKTSLAGIQGLKTAEYVSLLGESFQMGSINVTTLVNIHNPSNLTLNLGDLIFKSGSDVTEAGFVGFAYLLALELTPGDNNVVAEVVFNTTYPAATVVIGNLYSIDQTIYLYAFDGTSNNTALSAGLGSILTATNIPVGTPSPTSTTPYDPDWSMTCGPTTVTDGYCNVTVTFNNAYYLATEYFVAAIPPVSASEGVSYLSLFYNGQIMATPLILFEDNFKFVLQPNQSTTITFPVLFNTGAFNAQRRNLMLELVGGAAENALKFYVYLVPIITLGNSPEQTYPYWGSDYIYPDTMYVNVATGSDIHYALDWFDNTFFNNVTTTDTTANLNATAATTVTAATAVTTATTATAATTVTAATTADSITIASPSITITTITASASIPPTVTAV